MSVSLYRGPIYQQEDPITREPLNQTAVITSCGHLFNRESLRNWVIKYDICFLCNQPLTLDDETIEEKFFTTVRKMIHACSKTTINQALQVSCGTALAFTFFLQAQGGSIDPFSAMLATAISVTGFAWIESGRAPVQFNRLTFNKIQKQIAKW